MLLALDGSTTRTGFAFGDETYLAPKTGSWKFYGASDGFDRTISSALESVGSLCRLIRATHVVIEAPIHVPDRSAATMMALVQLTGVLRAAALRAGARIVEPIASQSVRAHFIGHGGLKKNAAEDQIRERCEKLGWATENHDARDAAATWSWGMAKYFPDSPGALAGARTPLLARAS